MNLKCPKISVTRLHVNVHIIVYALNIAGGIMALFGDGVSQGRREPHSLVEFRAGKMKLNGKTVSADTRKGLVFLRWDTEESLLHYCWKDRQNGKMEDVSIHVHQSSAVIVFITLL